MTVQAFPLHWPISRPRSRACRDAAFRDGNVGGRRVSISIAYERLQTELDALRATNVILSTNIELRLDGRPRGGTAEPIDHGAALYFKLKGKDTVLACDRWDRVADNVVAIAKHIEALRGMDRWGVGTLEQAFAGYQALPAPEQWWQVLRVRAQATRPEIESAYRALARTAHPDTGGSDAAMARLNAARDAALANALAQHS